MSSNSSSSSTSSLSSVSKSKSSKWLYKQKSCKSNPPPTIAMSPLPPPNIKLIKEDELQQVFWHFDSDGDGKISSLELRTYFGSIGEYMSHEEAQSVINDLDLDGDGLIDFHDFMRLMMERGGSEDDIKRAFEMFEAEKGSGCITPKSLQRMLNRLGDSKSFEECQAMIRVYDLDDNGILDFHEFHRMMA
ncbi:hypothetical protein IFM89_010952 [Coptis chinensis]|uniref:EF-hand domain-containing protein n=1 Tax=Coptis chinensis TaxID=261450 RepID=A0A835IPB9_9MAGN|nr:hypothetical protein IFM89_010952 [Coptis chinensis]